MIPSTRLLLLVLIAAFPAAVAGAVAPGWETAGWLIAALCLALAVLDAVLGRVSLRGITTQATEVIHVYKDRPATVRTLLNNQSGQARQLRVTLDFPESFDVKDEELRIGIPAADGSYALDWTLTAHRRGRFVLNTCYVETRSPLGLWDVREGLPMNAELRVYPNLRAPQDLLALRKGLAGVHAQRQIGQGREFEKLREYSAGDAFSDIHWKATARRAKPITKVFQVERTQEIYVIIDSSRLCQRPINGETTLERYITAGLLLGSATESNGDLFGLAAFSDKLHGFVRARNGKAHYASCRDAIYRIQPNLVSPDFEEIATFLRLNLRRRAMLIFLTQLDDPVIAESFVRATRILGKQHLILAAALAPTSVGPLFGGAEAASLDDVYARLASHTAWRGLEKLKVELRRQGVHLALLDAGSEVEQLVKLYGGAKQRQLL